MIILVTGATGQLGCDVKEELEKRGHKVLGTGSRDLNITEADEVKKSITELMPDAVVHCAAYTKVDAAETECGLCEKINVEGTRNIVKVCKELDIKMIYISTDYVFSGDGERPWEPDDRRDPINVYGHTKCEGEEIVQKLLRKYFIVRISWVFGKNGQNFVKKMIELGRKNGRVSVISDQIGSPTYTKDLAVFLADIVVTDKYGIYHATNEGECSWYEFACEIFRQAGLEVDVTAVDSTSFSTAAKRPLNSRMSKAKIESRGFKRLPVWQDALRRYLIEIQE